VRCVCVCMCMCVRCVCVYDVHTHTHTYTLAQSLTLSRTGTPTGKQQEARARLHAIGLDKADAHELATQQSQRSAQDLSLSKSLAAKLSFTREQWEEEASFLQHLFLRSTRISTLRSYVDEDGCPVRQRASRATTQRRSTAGGAEEEDAVSEEVAKWSAGIRLRVSLLRSYVEEVQGACTRFELYASDNTLQPMIARLLACVHVLECVNAEPAQPPGPVPQDQLAQSTCVLSRESLDGEADDSASRNRVPCETSEAAGAAGYTDANGAHRGFASEREGKGKGSTLLGAGQVLRKERLKVEGEIQRCEEIVSRLRSDVTMMMRHRSALKDERETSSYTLAREPPVLILSGGNMSLE
jgi:hypothetical protein